MYIVIVDLYLKEVIKLFLIDYKIDSFIFTYYGLKELSNKKTIKWKLRQSLPFIKKGVYR